MLFMNKDETLQHVICCDSLQTALEQLVSEYQQLNQALRAEKKLYQNLNHMQSTEDRLGPEIRPDQTISLDPL